MLRLLLILAGLLYGATVLAAVGVWGTNAPPATSTFAPPTQPVAAPRAGKASGPIVGFAISFHYADDVGPFLKVVDELADLGVNSLQVVTPAFQKDGAAEKIELLPGQSARREHLLALLQHAKARGLRTSLMPIVLFSEPRGNEWRGKISPGSWDKWWDSYRRVQDYFSAIAAEAGVDAYAVGSELLSTERNTARWTDLIAHLRRRFAGQLYYSTNWDHYHVPTFWKELDMIGISCYWDVTTHVPSGQSPTPAAVAQRWGEIRQQVLEFARKQGRPVVLTEVGYPSLPWGLKDPWNYVSGGEDKADHATQAVGYRGFLQAWEDLLTRAPSTPSTTAATQPTPAPPSSFAGVYFYSWQPWDTGGDDDTGYGVKGKPAYNILHQWLEKRGYLRR